jgi:uncharacterized protein (DUF885 family)
LVACLLVVISINFAFANNKDLANQQRLNQLFSEYWDFYLSTLPEYASIIGDKRWNDKLNDLSQKAVDARVDKTKEFLTRLESINNDGLNEQDILSKRLLVYRLRQTLEHARFKEWRMPLDQRNGIHLHLPQLITSLRFKTAKDYDDYITRMNSFPKAIDEVIEQMRKGMTENLVLPTHIINKLVDQLERLSKQEVEKTPFYEAVIKFPDEMSEEVKREIRNRFIKAIKESVLPGYSKLAKFIREEYAMKGRKDVGLWSLSDGKERYQAIVRYFTTTDLTPEEIHTIGLREVERIRKEKLEIARKLNYKSIEELEAAIEKDPKLQAGTREKLLELYRNYIKSIESKLPELFGRLPKARLEVAPMESFREKEAPAAQYQIGLKDGSRPGRVLVNTREPEEQRTHTIEAIAYHEGLPGHHLERALSQESSGYPAFRQYGRSVAYIEGWGLYAERLGKEIGMYKDLYSEYGRIETEMFRAIRLVVDTGIHYKKWTREQAVAYFKENSTIDNTKIESEIDRYITNPGQALAYMIGQMKILELRERARRELGDKFDIRSFHDEVLVSGALPLSILEERINSWIARSNNSKVHIVSGHMGF